MHNDPPNAAPHCEHCGDSLTEFGTCDDCARLLLELEQDDVWHAYLHGLKHGEASIVALSDLMAGWRYLKAHVTREKSSRGVSIVAANCVLFHAPGHTGFACFSYHVNGTPYITVCQGSREFPDWLITFDAYVPPAVFTAALSAVVHG